MYCGIGRNYAGQNSIDCTECKYVSEATKLEPRGHGKYLDTLDKNHKTNLMQSYQI